MVTVPSSQPDKATIDQANRSKETKVHKVTTKAEVHKSLLKLLQAATSGVETQQTPFEPNLEKLRDLLRHVLSTFVGGSVRHHLLH